MAPRQARIWPGSPTPLGATWDGRGVNFALFSANATKVELCLFDRNGRREIERLALPEHSDEVWHGYLPEARPGLLYGYRVHGPYDPQNGHRFNPNKLCLDPYAKALYGEVRWSDAHFGYRIGSPRSDLSFDRRDNSRGVPKARVVDPAFSWGGDRPLRRPLEESVIYETHLRGYTMLHPEVPQPLRGTCAGFASRPVVEHLVKLGVTAVEFLPIHAIIDERNLVSKGLRNFWGYSSIGYFTPESRYLASGMTGEFKSLVRVLHEAGIEVILDVVYNHSAEGNELGPTFCFKGIDNASYYRLVPGEERYYIDETGCGNTLNLSHPRVLQMVMDSLRYWVEVMHVDGFRFDLCTTLGREGTGFDPGSGFFDVIRQDPVLAHTKLIAEPWDVGPGGYQLGNFPAGWSEWNDRYRDALRRFWRGDPGMLPELGRRVTGSSDLFEHHGRRPSASINFVTAHDGYTLEDLVSYEQKHNEANGEDNNDGHDENYSLNHGVEGPSTDPRVLSQRARHKRNLMASLLLSQGAPMLLAGDEFGRSQNGNNNAYCHDNEISWVRWDEIDDDDRAFTEFLARLIKLRAAHPVLRRRRYLHGTFHSASGLADISWYSANGTEKTEEDWHRPDAKCFGLLLNGHAEPELRGNGLPLPDGILLIIVNGGERGLDFILPKLAEGRSWQILADSAHPTRPREKHHSGERPLRVLERSLMLLKLEKEEAKT